MSVNRPLPRNRHDDDRGRIMDDHQAHIMGQDMALALIGIAHDPKMLRDFFAGCALIGLMYDSIPTRVIPTDNPENPGKIEFEVDAELAFKVADAMLAAREE